MLSVESIYGNTLVRPHVEYRAAIMLGYILQKMKNYLRKIQQKMIINMEGKSFEERIRCLGLWTPGAMEQTDLTEVFKRPRC